MYDIEMKIVKCLKSHHALVFLFAADKWDAITLGLTLSLKVHSWMMGKLIIPVLNLEDNMVRMCPLQFR